MKNLLTFIFLNLCISIYAQQAPLFALSNNTDSLKYYSVKLYSDNASLLYSEKVEVAPYDNKYYTIFDFMINDGMYFVYVESIYGTYIKRFIYHSL